MAVLQGLMKEEASIHTLLSSFFLPSLLLALVLWQLFKHRTTKSRDNASLPPGPCRLPIIGNLHQLSNQPHLSLNNLAQKFGPIMHLQLGHVPTIIISSAEMAKEVTKTHDLAIASRPQLYSANYFFYNCTDIAFAPYGHYWRQVRKICTLELFSAKRVQSFSQFRQEEVARLVHRIGSSYPQPVNLSHKIGLYANDVLCKSAFGRIFSEGGKYERHGFHNMLVEYQILVGGFSVGDFFPALEWINIITGMKERILRTFKRFDAFFDELIEEHLDPKRATYENKDLVDLLLNIQKNGSSEVPLDINNVKALIMDIFVAGTDTTYITVDWGMTELMLNPRVLKKAQAEVRSVMGERQWVLESDIHQMHYLKAVIKETFRLHPPAPVLLPKESMQEVEIKGYKIPPKTRFYFNAWAIGRDPTCYDDPDVFAPERFIDSSIDYRGLDFELIPFGIGRRICPAIGFGEASVQLALAQLLHSFDWELPSGVEPKDLDLMEVFGITMHREANLIVVAKPQFSE